MWHYADLRQPLCIAFGRLERQQKQKGVQRPCSGMCLTSHMAMPACLRVCMSPGRHGMIRASSHRALYTRARSAGQFARLQGRTRFARPFCFGSLIAPLVLQVMAASSSSSPASATAARAALSGLGCKVYVSQRHVKSVLKDLQTSGLLKDELTASRSSIKRAREDDLMSKSNAYGTLLQDLRIPLQFVNVPYLSPPALLAHLAQQDAFGGFLKKRLEQTPCTHEAPWRLVVYADEVTPGNALKPLNTRRIQALYWTFLDFGPHGMAAEALWMPLCCLRSHLCSAIGGLTVLWRRLLKVFFAPHDLRAGLCLQTPGGPHVLFAKLEVLVADEAALKHSVESKGAAGVLFCMRCSNVVPHKSRLGDVSNDVVPSTCTNYARFKLHTNASTRELLRHLQEQEGRLSQARFRELEKVLGFNFRPNGLLMDDVFGYAMPECIMFDWMHIYMVHGTVGNEVGYLLAVLRDAGFTEERIGEFVDAFKWPSQFSGASPKGLLKQKRDHKRSPLRGSASEQLNLLPVLRLFILLFVWHHVPEDVQQACRCFLKLVELIEMLQSATRGISITPSALHACIVEHSQCLLQTYGDELWVPKNHMAMHLHEFLGKHGALISCFVHERKHKVVKRFGNQMCTMQSFEQTLLKDVLSVQLESLLEGPPSEEVRLLQQRPVSKKLQGMVQEALSCSSEVAQAAKAVHGGGFVCATGDVVVFNLHGEDMVGKVNFHAECNGLLLTCVTPWDLVHGYMYRLQDQSLLVDLSCIKACCIWSEKDQQAIVIRP